MQKYNYSFYMVLFLSLVVALYYKKPATTILLFLVGLIGYFVQELKSKEEVETIDQEHRYKREIADTRADSAYEKLDKLINAIPSPLVYINQRGEFSVENIHFRQLVNVKATDVYDVNMHADIRQIMLDAFLNEKQFIREFEYEKSDFQVHSVPIIEEGRYSGCMLIFQDVTRITEGEKNQKRFIADASHELRTPITSILGMIEILNSEEFNDDKTEKEFLQQIEKETKRLNEIVSDLLLQSRLKANQVLLEKNVFNLRQFFEGLIYEKRLELHKNNIEVILNCPSDLEIYADQFRLTQVFLNLFNNAINYSEKGKINIDCSYRKNRFKIEFQDNGQGIPEEILPHIFDRFFKGQSDRSREFGGSGLGLAISKSIIETHKGTIDVQSKLGQGTLFTIILPKN